MLAQLREMPVKSCLINLFAGVIVNNKGEMKGSAITGKRFPNQTQRKVKSILIKQIQNIKEIRHCEKKTKPILMKISEY